MNYNSHPAQYGSHLRGCGHGALIQLICWRRNSQAHSIMPGHVNPCEKKMEKINVTYGNYGTFCAGLEGAISNACLQRDLKFNTRLKTSAMVKMFELYDINSKTTT